MTKRGIGEEEPGPAESTMPRSAGAAIAGLALAMLLSSLGTSVANIALPTLVAAFGASFGHVQWVVLAYLLAITSLIVSAGRLGDMIGHRRLLLIGIGLFTGASLMAGAAPVLWLLIVARALQGAGAAIMMSLAIAMVGDAVPRSKAGKAMGLLGSMSAIGTALGPSAGGALIEAFGWRSIFFVNLPLGLLAFAIVSRSLAPDRRRPGPRTGFEVKGTLLLAPTLAAYALAMTGGRAGFGLSNAALLLAAAAGVRLFVAVEAKAKAPLVPPGSFANPRLSAGLVASGVVATVVMAMLVVSPFYLSDGLGLEAAHAGLLLSIGPIAAACTGIPSGRLVDRYGAGRVTAAGLLLTMAGCLLLSALPPTSGLWGYVLPVIGVTVGYSMFQTANNAAVMAHAAADRRGAVSAMLNLSRNLGLVTGASAMGAVFALASGGGVAVSADPSSVAFGFRLTFAVAAGLIAALLLLQSLGPTSRASRYASGT